MQIENHKRSLFNILATLALLALPKMALAFPLDIISTPQHIGGFTHNVFHTSVNGGGSGSILAWFDLNTSETNTYDPIKGDLMAHFNVFNASGFGDPTGSVWASGNLPGANFQGDGGVAGTITWTFDLNVDNALQDYLNGQSVITMTYLDQIYTSTTFGTDVSSWDEPYLSLWGSGPLSVDTICDQDEYPFSTKQSSLVPGQRRCY